MNNDAIKIKIYETLPDDFTNKDDLINQVFESFYQDNKSKNKIEKLTHDFLIINSHSHTSISVKPSNIILNWRKLFQSISNIALTGVGVNAQPVLWPFAGLIIWNEIWSNLKVELSLEHAVIMTAFWNNKNNENKIKKKEGLKHINNLLKEYKMNSIEKERYKELLKDLEKMGCIEVNQKNKMIWLREWIKKSYKT